MSVMVQAWYILGGLTPVYIIGRNAHPNGSTKGRGFPLRHFELRLTIEM